MEQQFNQPINTPAKARTKWKLATVVMTVVAITLGLTSGYLYQELNISQDQLNSQKTSITNKSNKQSSAYQSKSAVPNAEMAQIVKQNNAPSNRPAPKFPAGINNLDITGLAQAYADHYQKIYKTAPPEFKIAVFPQANKDTQYIKINGRQSHIIAMLDVVYTRGGGAKAVFYRRIDKDDKWVCASIADQFLYDDALTKKINNKTRVIFHYDKFWDGDAFANK